MRIADWTAYRRLLADAATEGPWEDDGGGVISQHYSRPDPLKIIVDNRVECIQYCYGGTAQGVERNADAVFIADSRTALPQALDALEAVLKPHERGVMMAISRECWEGDCECDDEHVTFPVYVCAACRDFAETVDDYALESDGVVEAVEWPCRLVRTIAEALGVEP